jgi:hypothetical protein
VASIKTHGTHNSMCEKRKALFIKSKLRAVYSSFYPFSYSDEHTAV